MKSTAPALGHFVPKVYLLIVQYTITIGIVYKINRTFCAFLQLKSRNFALHKIRYFISGNFAAFNICDNLLHLCLSTHRARGLIIQIIGMLVHGSFWCNIEINITKIIELVW